MNRESMFYNGGMIPVFAMEIITIILLFWAISIMDKIDYSKSWEKKNGV